MAQARRKTETDPVAEAAKQALQHCDGDVKKATKFLEDAVRKDYRLREALTDPLIAGACYDAVRAQVRTDRKAVWSPPNTASGPAATPEAKARQAERVVALSRGTMLSFPLPGGKKLGEATRGDVTKAATFYERQSGDMASKARWLQLVAQSVPPGKKVSEVLTDKRLRELQAEAKKG